MLYDSLQMSFEQFFILFGYTMAGAVSCGSEKDQQLYNFFSCLLHAHWCYTMKKRLLVLAQIELLSVLLKSPLPDLMHRMLKSFQQPSHLHNFSIQCSQCTVFHYSFYTGCMSRGPRSFAKREALFFCSIRRIFLKHSCLQFHPRFETILLSGFVPFLT